MGLGELGCHPQVTDGWTFRLRERKRHVGRSAWHVRVPAKQSLGREGRRTEGKIRKARRAQTVTHWPLDQPLTQIGSKMSLKLPRNWDFNLKAEAVKIGKVRVQVFSCWGLMLERPLFACWAVGAQVSTSNNTELGGNLHPGRCVV